MFGMKVYPDNLTNYLDWEVDFYEIYIRPKDYMGYPIDLAAQIESHEQIRDKVLGIHGGILNQDVNFLDAGQREYNLAAISMALDSAKHFDKSEYIVFHPGCMIFGADCSLANLVDIVAPITDPRFMIEFKPIFSYKRRHCFPVHHVDDWVALKKMIGKEIVIDIGHALITAEAMNYEPVKYLKELFAALDPKVVHVALKGSGQDGYEDSHPHLYETDFDLFHLSDELQNRILTLEVKDPDPTDLELLKAVVNKDSRSLPDFLNQYREKQDNAEKELGRHK